MHMYVPQWYLSGCVYYDCDIYASYALVFGIMNYESNSLLVVLEIPGSVDGLFLFLRPVINVDRVQPVPTNTLLLYSF